MGGKKLGEGSSGVALPSGNSLFSNDGQSAPEAVDSQVRYAVGIQSVCSRYTVVAITLRNVPGGKSLIINFICRDEPGHQNLSSQSRVNVQKEVVHINFLMSP